jgi:hypothetical protein
MTMASYWFTTVSSNSRVGGDVAMIVLGRPLGMNDRSFLC